MVGPLLELQSVVPIKIQDIKKKHLYLILIRLARFYSVQQIFSAIFTLQHPVSMKKMTLTKHLLLLLARVNNINKVSFLVQCKFQYAYVFSLRMRCHWRRWWFGNQEKPVCLVDSIPKRSPHRPTNIISGRGYPLAEAAKADHVSAVAYSGHATACITKRFNYTNSATLL